MINITKCKEAEEVVVIKDSKIHRRVYKWAGFNENLVNGQIS